MLLKVKKEAKKMKAKMEKILHLQKDILPMLETWHT